jgi:hypothetical protein
MNRATDDLTIGAEEFSPPGDKVERVERPDPFDPARLRLDPGAELVGIKRVIANVPIRRPKRQEFIRVHPSTTAEHQWLRSAVAIGSVALTLAAKDRSH